MRKLLNLLIGLTCVGLVHTAPAEAKRFALVVGIDKYDNLGPELSLQKAVGDARAMDKALTELGFEVTKLEDVRLDDFNVAWNDLQRKLTEDDTLLMFFAGHGIEMSGNNYLLPRDVPKVAERDSSLLRSKSILFSQLTEDLQERHVQVSIFILDACRDNPFRDGKGRSIASLGRGLNPAQAPAKGSFVIYSAAQGQTALDRLGANDTNANSVFTRKLLPLLREPGLSLPDLAGEVRTQVADLAQSIKHDQVPAYYDNILGKFIFRPLEDVALSVKPGTGQSFVDHLSNHNPCPYCPSMVVVPAGNFTMGSPIDETGRFAGAREQQVKVRFERPFAVAKASVTFAEWDACVVNGGCRKYSPSAQDRGRRPVVNVNWDDAKAYVTWLSQQTGMEYRLLSEAEREYVTRAGTSTPFWWGNAITPEEANYDVTGGRQSADTLITKVSRWLPFVRRTATPSLRPPLPVDAMQPNRWGLHHVHGNVWEWTEDCWHDSNAGNPGDGSARRSAECKSHVLRGGAWDVPPEALRAGNRFAAPTETREASVGFRVARSITP